MRHIFWIISLFVAVAVVLSYLYWPTLGIILSCITIPLFLVGFYDTQQSSHAVLKNFPVIGHFRYMFETIRPEIQQYFVETNIDGRPVSRNLRSLVYQRAKRELQTLPFGTQHDLYAEGREWICHSLFPKEPDQGFDRVMVGSPQCEKPYSCSRFNISAMSYGSMSSNAIVALNLGAKAGGFFHNTGEGGISPYHKNGGDLVWQIGTGYFGCRKPDGKFDLESFAKKAQGDSVKMIELKLSQGAKPGKGGILPAAKVTREIAAIREVEPGKDVISPASHSEFSNAGGLMEFIQRLREASGGKPVGIKLCLGKFEDFDKIVKAMVESKTYPDFVTVDGSEGGTGAAPLEFSDHVGIPLKDGLAHVHAALIKAGLRQHIKVMAAGRAFTGFDLIKFFALGADIVNSARGMMLALGCIQALRCNSNHCPVGITTNNPSLVKGLVIKHKAPRVANYHRETLKSVKDLLTAMAKSGPEQIQRKDIFQRQADSRYKTFEDIYGPV